MQTISGSVYHPVDTTLAEEMVNIWLDPMYWDYPNDDDSLQDPKESLYELTSWEMADRSEILTALSKDPRIDFVSGQQNIIAGVNNIEFRTVVEGQPPRFYQVTSWPFTQVHLYRIVRWLPEYLIGG